MYKKAFTMFYVSSEVYYSSNILRETKKYFKKLQQVVHLNYTLKY